MRTPAKGTNVFRQMCHKCDQWSALRQSHWRVRQQASTLGTAGTPQAAAAAGKSATSYPYTPGVGRQARPADQAGHREMRTRVVTGTLLRILDAGYSLKGSAASFPKYRYPESRSCARSFRVPASIKRWHRHGVRRSFRYATSRTCFTSSPGREMGSLLFSSPLAGTGAATAAPSR